MDPRMFAPFNLGEILERKRRMQMQRMQMEDHRAKIESEKAEREALAGVFGGGGALGSAAPGAISEGGATGQPNRHAIGALMQANPALGMQVRKYFDGLDEDSRKREGDKWKAAGPVLMRLKSIPQEQRAAYARAALPQLQASGWTAEELANVDLSDQSIDALSTTAMTVSEVIDSQRVRWEPIGENGSFAIDNLGNPVGSGNPFAPQPQGQPSRKPASAPTLNDTIQSRATNYGGFGGRQSEFHVVGLPGETVTSTRRSAAHNRDVGGVRNSYHLNGQARDSTPPPGMSMAQYASEMTRLNPHLEVINEGDHVHTEPRSQQGGVDKKRILQQANAAIQRGADPAKVKARLREMGIVQ